jgi:hypothetical protein
MELLAVELSLYPLALFILGPIMVGKYSAKYAVHKLIHIHRDFLFIILEIYNIH